MSKVKFTLDLIFLPNFIDFMNKNLNQFNEQNKENSNKYNDYINKYNNQENLDVKTHVEFFKERIIFNILIFYYKNNGDLTQIFDFTNVNSQFPYKTKIYHKENKEGLKVYSNFVKSLLSFANRLLKENANINNKKLINEIVQLNALDEENMRLADFNAEFTLDLIFQTDFYNFMNKILDQLNKQNRETTDKYNECINKYVDGTINNIKYMELFKKFIILDIINFYYVNKRDLTQIFDFTTVYSKFLYKREIFSNEFKNELKIYSNFVKSLLIFANRLLKEKENINNKKLKNEIAQLNTLYKRTIRPDNFKVEFTLDLIFQSDFMQYMNFNYYELKAQLEKNNNKFNMFIIKQNKGEFLNSIEFIEVFKEHIILKIITFYYNNDNDLNKIFEFNEIYSTFPYKGKIYNNIISFKEELKIYKDFVGLIINFAYKILKIIIMRASNPSMINKDFNSIIKFNISNDELIEKCNHFAYKNTSCKELIVKILFLNELLKKSTTVNTSRLGSDANLFYAIFYFMKYYKNICIQSHVFELNKYVRSNMDFTISILKNLEDAPIKNNLNFTIKSYNINKEQYLTFYNENIKELINTCLNKFIILNIFLDLPPGPHANMLIYNPNTKEVEVFEPDFIRENMDELYKKIVKDLFPNAVYIMQKDYIKEYFQAIQVQECDGFENGLCGNWAIWYADQRLQYPNIGAVESFQTILNKVNERIKREKTTLTKIVLEFSKKFKSKRKEVLTDANIIDADWGDYLLEQFEREYK